MFDEIFFLLSASLTVIGAVSATFTKNLMHACVYLLLSLFGVAGLYAVIGADFLAATQLVVYAGGVVILMLFAVMLTGGHESKWNRFGFLKTPAMGNKKTYFVGGLSAIVIGVVILKILRDILILQNVAEVSENSFLPTVERIGTLLVTDHVLAFEISSVLLLGALVGAAVISRPRNTQ